MNRFLIKVLALILISLTGFSSLSAEPYAWATTTPIQESALKAKVRQLGLGAQVKLTAFSGKRYQGYITDITDHSVQVTDAKTLRVHSLDFSSVERIAGRPLPDPSDPIGNRILRSIFRATSRFAVGP